MKTMKVLHVIPSVGPARGGPSFVLRALVRGLVESGVEVDVAVTDDNGRGRLDVRYGIPVSDAGATYWYFPRQSRFYTLSLPLNRWLARHVTDYDIVHIHALFSFPSVAAAYWAKRRRVPYIVRPLGTLNHWGMEKRRPWLKRLSLRFLESGMLSGAAAIHYTSEQERLEAADCGITNHPIVIPNPLESVSSDQVYTRGLLRSKYPSFAERRWVLFLSRFDRKKGLDLLLPAFALLRSRYPDAALVLAGDGDTDYVAGLRRQAVSLHIDKDILWTGFLKGEDKRAAFADADVFALPSYSENFGVAAVEALAAGCPVIVSDQVAIHDDICAAQAGVVVRCDSGDLAAALSHVLADTSASSKMGRNGKCLIQTQYSLEAVTSRLMAAYNSISN